MTTAAATNRTTVFNLGLAAVWVDRFTMRSPRPTLERTGLTELEIQAGHYTILIAAKVPSKGTIKATVVGLLAGATLALWGFCHHLM